MGSKSYSTRNRALETAEGFQNLFSTDAVAVHIAPTPIAEMNCLDESAAADQPVFTATDFDSESEPYNRNEKTGERHARYRRELFESAEKLTTEAEEAVGLLSARQGLKRWHQAFNAVTSIQLNHLVKGNAPKVVAWSDRGTGGTRNSARPCVPDFLAEVWLAARRSLSLTQFTIWKQLVVEEKGERLEPTRAYFETPYAVTVSRRSARLRHEEEKRQTKTGRRLHRKAA